LEHHHDLQASTKNNQSLTDTLAATHSTRRNEAGSDRSSRWLGSLLDYLDDTFEQEWSLQNMAAEMGVHPVYLCRTFSEHFDCTLGEYIRKQRVLRAWRYLQLATALLPK
jgi:YesN/AraC family two-component response regulator